MAKSKTNYLLISFLLCLTIGLAPFNPEPHLFGKIKWLLGDPSSMALKDWFDLIMHGTPWVAFLYFLIKKIASK